ncbi:MAG: DNA cytosine methyltransferase, partial [bacterium]|nr:DNA cytosine methyltransferase [bacterium]
MSRTIRSIDLFAGAGGLSLGFDLANDELEGIRFEPVFAVEHDPAAALTYKTNFGVGVYDGDIEGFDPITYPEAEIIVGGPPCQGFSPL